MRTYYIENSKGVQGYYTKLKDAQWDLSRYHPTSWIICMSGPYKFEGFYLYRMIIVNSASKGGPKFIRQRI